MIRNTPIRRPRRKPESSKPVLRKSVSWKPRRVLVAVAVAVVLLILAWAVIARSLAPGSNTSLSRFDAIIVLGTPADSDGNPRPEQLARVTEAVHEYQKGVAPRLILTGGPTRGHFVEARVMARSAQALGIPESAIYVEPEAMDTIHNACYSVRIMKAHDWGSAEVIASDAQRPRASLIFSQTPIQWNIHAALPLSPDSPAYLDGAAAVEVLKTARYLIWARWAEQCEP